ncbi:neurofilament heavy polypeptide-like [Montipora capricornis]|uniref:neurofilament heavy polypeptide-like n=1 Tax=Montipora capricornis TaxID=246305 RepID=UPI0035F149C6
MWHMFSLANVLGCTVQSVYPDVQNPGTNRSLVNIFIRPAVAADPNVKIMWSHCSNTSKKGWGPNHFVPLIPVGAVGKQKGEWVNVKGKRKIGKRNAESPVGWQEKQKAESPVTGNKKQKVESPVKGNEKRKAVSPDKGNEKPKAESPDKENGKPKAESPDQGNEKQKVESPVKGNEKPRAESPDKGKGKPKVESPVKRNQKPKVETPVKGNEKRKAVSPDKGNEKPKAESPDKENGKPKAESPDQGNEKQKVESPVKGNEKPRAESPDKGKGKPKVESPVKGNEKQKVESPVKGNEKPKAESPVKGNQKQKVESPIKGNEKWKAESPVNRNYRKENERSGDVSCKHQGRADVERHINKDIHQNNTKRLEGQNKLPFCSKQDPLAEKQIKSEVLFTSFLVEHNMPLSAADHAGALFKQMFPVSDIASKFSCARTKTTAIMKEALAPLSKEHVIASSRNSPYCFATDGSSDEDEKLFPLMFR